MRGYQKKVIYMKNPGSPVFEEAYFILSGKGESGADADIISEANRIIEENTGQKKRKFSLSGFLKNGIVFAAGFISSAIILAIIIMT